MRIKEVVPGAHLPGGNTFRLEADFLVFVNEPQTLVAYVAQYDPRARTKV